MSVIAFDTVKFQERPRVEEVRFSTKADIARIERWFKLFQWNQLARWFVLEWGLPLALGVWAIWLSWPFGRLLP